jgi:hypothetical protein
VHPKATVMEFICKRNSGIGGVFALFTDNSSHNPLGRNVCKHLAVSMPNLPVFAFDNESMLTLSE